MLRRASCIFSTEDARRLAQRRLPRLVFDFVDGAAGREVGAARNQTRFDEILLQPRAMADVAERNLETIFLGHEFSQPFGIAPMGMCNLVCPGADKLLAKAAGAFGLPLCLSSAGSSSLEDMRTWAGTRAWFQLYFGQSAEASLATVDRALKAGYDTLVLTVDVPQVSRRVRDARNGFTMPFRISPQVFWDFANHPRWAISTLMSGVPSPKNFGDRDKEFKFDRNASRAGADWRFLAELRDRWPGKLIVKGITSQSDARRVQSLGVDAIYVSNHGARQLDSAPPAIDLLPLIRGTVGPDYPLIFDSGIQNGEDVVKALALGADFVMLGRPALFALGAEGGLGLTALLNCFVEDISVAMAQIGVTSISELGPELIFSNTPIATDETKPVTPSTLQIATKS
ncbi:MAG: alpha-hydroxy acid oxidase [Boseongicola sp.]